MQFSNQATLSYSAGTVSSNLVAGELLPTLSIEKNASLLSYEPDGRLRYTVSIVNTSAAAYTGLTLLDDLGRYEWQGFGRFPMAYTEDTAAISYYSGTEITAGTVTARSATEGISFVFDIPGKTTALLSYEVYPTSFAPLEAGSEVTNTVSVRLGEGQPLITAQNTLPVSVGPALEISKSVCGTAVAGQSLSYSFTVSNYGNAATDSENSVVISDQLSPPLEDLSVYADGVLWTEGVQYYYDSSIHYFQTAAGAVQLAAAQFEQDSFGRWNTTPASTVITLTGTASGAQTSQSLIEVLPAYADGREVFLRAVRQRNDHYVLSGTCRVPPVFMVMSHPDAPLTLAAGTNIRFSLHNNLLTVNTAGLTTTATAFITVGYGGGFTLRVDYLP